MGRGKGGSTSYGKRTPGGIRTSSKMSQVGEIEAKHGVLGDVDTSAPDRIDNTSSGTAKQEFVDKNSQAALDAMVETTLKNQGQPATDETRQAFLQTDEGRAVAEGIKQQVAAMADKVPVAKTFEPVSTGAASGLEALEKPAQRSYDEMKGMITQLRRDNMQGYDAIEKLLYGYAGAPASSHEIKDLYLRVRAILDTADASSGFASTVVSHLRDNDGKVEASAEEFDPTPDSAFYADNDTAAAKVSAYKAILGSEEGRTILKGIASGTISIDASGFKQPYYSGARLSGQESVALRENVSSVHKLGAEKINNIREAFGLGAVELPEHAQEALKGQPVSEKLFRLVYDNNQPNILDDNDRAFHNARKRLDASEMFFAGKYKRTEGITPFEAYAVQIYTSSGYGIVNAYLRDLDKALSGYENAKSDNLKVAFGRKLKELLADTGSRQLTAAFMSGMTKILNDNKEDNPPRVVTRGTHVPRLISEGDYFYDAGALSSALRSSQSGKWAENPDQFVYVTDQAIDARSFSGFSDEEEFIVMPGTVFKADLVTTYRPAAIDTTEQQVVVGRQANMKEEGAPELVNASGAWEGEPVTHHEVPPTESEAYEKRFAPGRDLASWLLGKSKASRYNISS